jgi:hypothetical protein
MARPLLQRIQSWEPHYALLVLLVWGLIVLLSAAGLDVLTFLATPPYVVGVAREVGYLAAVNWSVTYTLLFPVAAYLMVDTLRTVPSVVRRLHDHRMVRNRDLEVIAESSLIPRWYRGTPVRKWFLVVTAVVVPLGYSLVEWFRNNLLRLLKHGPPASAPDYDWGLAGLMRDWPDWRLLLNALLDLLAFLSQAMLIAALVTFFLYLLDFATLLPKRAGEGPLTLLPDLASTDQRRGFEEFSPLLQRVLLVALVSYLMCYLVRLQGLYMVDTTTASLVEFIHDDIIMGVTAGSNFAEKLGALFATHAAGRQAWLAWLAAVLVLFFTLGVMIATVRTSADLARSNARLHYAQSPERSLCGGDPAFERDQLASMVLWPLGYLRLQLLLILVGLALLSLYYYRIGLYVFGLIAATLVGKVVKGIRSWGDS